jgi:ParB-like chromosome segregation protein Spo0J
MAASLDLVPPLAVTYRPVGTLRLDPRNARTHPKQQVDQIVASIRQFGFVNPILADPDGRIIAGHGRLMAAKAMRLAEVPTILIAGLSETQRRALRIADNKIALGAGWDLDVLRLELSELGSLDLDFDLSVTGFSTGELDVMLNATADPEDEVIPEVPASPRTRLGDIWILGEHRVGCVMHATSTLFGVWSARKRLSIPRFWIRLTTCGFPDMRMPWDATGNSRWLPVKWTRRSSGRS